jgi:hypothetical protein
MNQELRELYQELTSELYICFKNIIDSEDERSAYVEYMGQSPYNRRQDKGRIIVGRNEGEELSYAYRLRFNQNQNEPQKIKWYTREEGFNNLSVILGERKYIHGDLLKSYNRYSDSINEDICNYIDDLFTEINDQIQNIQRQYTVSDIKNKIKEHNKRFLQNIIATDRSSSVEIWKLLFSRNKNGDIVKNKVKFPYSDNTTLLAKTNRKYTDNGETRKYPFGLVIQKVDRKNRFFIHRIPRNENLESSKFIWDKRSVNKAMGFDRDYIFKNNIEIPNQYIVRIQPNLVVEYLDYSSEFRKYRNALFDEIQKIIHNKYRQFYKTEKSINMSNLSARIVGPGLEIHEGCSTSDVKDIQSEVQIPEKDVREQQEKRNIDRLSSNLRSEIIKDLYLSNFCDWIFDLSKSQIRKYQIEYEEEKNMEFGRYVSPSICGLNIEEKVREFVVQDVSELNKRGLYNFCNYITNRTFNDTAWNQIGRDHTVSIEDSVIHPYNVGMDGFSRNMINRVIVPHRTNLFIHEETGNYRRFKLNKGVYNFKTLNHINTIMYS